MELIFEKSHKGRTGNYYPAETPAGVKTPEQILPAGLLRQNPPSLPEVSELEFVRHILALCRRQVGIDSTFYPLGSCTMKYNPKINEAVARDPGFAMMHPLQPAEIPLDRLRNDLAHN